MKRHPVTLAIDPGPTQSAWVVHNPFSNGVRAFAVWENAKLLQAIRMRQFTDELDQVVIEKVESFGMAVGADVFETVFWSGRFAEAADFREYTVDRIGRLKIKLALCHDSRAKDSNIRQALIDRYGGPEAIGRKASPGPLYGIAGDVWSALAVAVAWAEKRA